MLPDLRREKNFVNLDVLLDGDSGDWIPAAAAAASWADAEAVGERGCEPDAVRPWMT